MRYTQAFVCAGTEATLRGCVNDANAIQKMLITHFGFQPNMVQMLIDTDQSGPQPTGAQIKKSLKTLVQASKPGDVLVFHFSGHGTQVRSSELPVFELHRERTRLGSLPAQRCTIAMMRCLIARRKPAMLSIPDASGPFPLSAPQVCNPTRFLPGTSKRRRPEQRLQRPQQTHRVQIADKDGGEADNKDEAICPTDMNLICDDDLHAILSPMPNTVHFTMISDCCHSGGMLDHPVQQISGDKDPNGPKGVDNVPERDLMGAFFKGAPVRAAAGVATSLRLSAAALACCTGGDCAVRQSGEDRSFMACARSCGGAALRFVRYRADHQACDALHATMAQRASHAARV